MLSQYLSLLFLSYILCGSLVGGNLMIPFGDEFDQKLSSVDDGHVRLDLKTPFVIDNEKFWTLFINVNGIVSFEEPTHSFEVNEVNGPFIAPFWGDVDLSGSVKDGNSIYYRISESDRDLEWVRIALEEAIGSSLDWKPKTVAIGTWHNVGFFMAQTSQLNTFQVVLATDGKESYGFFNYPAGGLNWWVSEQGQGSVVGYKTRHQNLSHSTINFFSNNNFGEFHNRWCVRSSSLQI